MADAVSDVAVEAALAVEISGTPVPDSAALEAPGIGAAPITGKGKSCRL